MFDRIEYQQYVPYVLYAYHDKTYRHDGMRHAFAHAALSKEAWS